MYANNEARRRILFVGLFVADDEGLCTQDSCPFDGMFWSTQPVKLDPSLTGGHSFHVEQGFGEDAHCYKFPPLNPLIPVQS